MPAVLTTRRCSAAKSAPASDREAPAPAPGPPPAGAAPAGPPRGVPSASAAALVDLVQTLLGSPAARFPRRGLTERQWLQNAGQVWAVLQRSPTALPSILGMIPFP